MATAQRLRMIELTTVPDTVELPPGLIARLEEVHADEMPPGQAWSAWFAPDDDRDGGHSER